MYDLWYLSQSGYQTSWYKFKERFPHARQKIEKESFEQTLFECARESFTNFFYTVSDNCIIKHDWDFNFKVNEYESQYIHTWPTNQNLFFDYNSITLWPKATVLENRLSFEKLLDNKLKQHNDDITQVFDIFFISYEEELADKNWFLLQSRFPRAQRVDQIKGISNAHKLCANLSKTEMFYTIDGDSTVFNNWDFTFIPPLYDREYLHLWYSKNPVNNLEYGYGGIKLWPTDKVKKFNQPWIDFTTSVGKLKIKEDVISITNFNTSSYNTWKSAFRECVKLSQHIKLNPNDIESINRLNTWKTVFNPVPFSEWAKYGITDALTWIDRNENIELINNFDWLKQYFINCNHKVKD